MEEGEAGEVDSGVVFSLPFLSPELRGARGPMWRGKGGGGCRDPRREWEGGAAEEGGVGQTRALQILVGTQSSPVAEFSKMLLRMNFLLF